MLGPPMHGYYGSATKNLLGHLSKLKRLLNDATMSNFMSALGVVHLSFDHSSSPRFLRTLSTNALDQGFKFMFSSLSLGP